MPSEFSPDTKTVTQVPSLLVDAGSDSILLVNNDANNTIYIGGDIGVSPFSRINNTIPPLGSITLDGSSGPIYAVTAIGQTAVCQIVPKGVSFAPSPVLIAQQILNSGVVIVDNPKVLNSGSVTIPSGGGGPTTLPAYLVNTFQSWILSMNVLTITSGTTPYLNVELAWSLDQAGLNTTYIENFIIDVNSSDPTTTYFGHGPMYGPYLNVSFLNYDSVSCKISFNLTASTRAINETTLRSTTGNAASSSGLGTDDILLNYDVAIPASSSSPVVPLNYYNGPVSIRFGVTNATAVNTVQMFLKFQPAAVDFGNNNSLVLEGPTATGGENDVVTNMNFPRRPVTVSFTNNQASGTVNVRCRIIAKGAVQ